MRAHSYTGKAKSRQKQGVSQAATVRPLLAYDQLGRPYDGVVQIRSGGSTGPLHPKYWAPIYPDPAFLKENPDNAAEQYVDFPNWYRARKQNEKAYHDRAARWAVKHKQPAPKMGDYDAAVEEEFGALNPGAASILVAAMYLENPWIIGACKGCSLRDPRTGEFLPRFSHNCRCEDGFTPFAPDPRLVKYIEQSSYDELSDSEMEDVGIDSYAELTKQSIEEVQQRPSQFRATHRRRPRAPIDGAQQLASEAELQTEVLESHDLGPEMSETDEAELNAAINELESAPEADIFADKSTSIDVEETEEKTDPAATGGRRIPPKQQERAARQAPRAGDARTPRQVGAQRSAQGKKASAAARAKALRERNGDDRPTLADGAEPVIAGE